MALGVESSYWHQPISHYLNLHLSLSFPLFTSGSKARRRGHLMSAECDPGVWSTAPSRVQAPGAQPLVRGSEGQEAKLINRIFASARLRRWLICPKICFCKTKKIRHMFGGHGSRPPWIRHCFYSIQRTPDAFSCTCSSVMHKMPLDSFWRHGLCIIFLVSIVFTFIRFVSLAIIIPIIIITDFMLSLMTRLCDSNQRKSQVGYFMSQ